jgi:hypothetical protein
MMKTGCSPAGVRIAQGKEFFAPASTDLAGRGADAALTAMDDSTVKDSAAKRA